MQASSSKSARIRRDMNKWKKYKVQQERKNHFGWGGEGDSYANRSTVAHDKLSKTSKIEFQKIAC